MAHFLSGIGDALGLEDADGEASQSSDVCRTIAGSNRGTIFIVVPVDDVVAAVLYGPMAALDGEQVLCCGLLRGLAGDPVCDVVRFLAGLFFDRIPFDDESLADVREIEVGVELGGGPDFSCVDSAMLEWSVVDMVGFLAILEEELEIFEEGGLVAFDGEEVVGLTFLDQITGEGSLCQEGVCGDGFALDVGDGVEQGLGGFDLIGSFEFFVSLRGELTDFFWA